LPKRGIFGRPIGKFKRLARYARPESLSARGVIYCGNDYARYARATRCHSRFFLLVNNSARALRDAGQASLSARQALAFTDGPAEYASIRQSSKINISLTITKIAKW